MEGKKSPLFKNGAIWFGASVSIAEILTGTLLAPLGFIKGILAIFIGHLVGAILMYLAGKIGADTGLSAMETVRKSFGKKGATFFAIMNVIQLVGWTSVMTGQGAGAAAVVGKSLTTNYAFWCIIIGIFILLWIITGLTNINKLNICIVTALLIMTVILSFKIFNGDVANIPISYSLGETISFGTAVELSIAMPLSWLPLISDYTRTGKNIKGVTGVSVGVYSIGSLWMFIIGMGATLLTGASDIPSILLNAGFGTWGLLIVLLSTVTTTFLDAFSAGVSTVTINHSVKEKIAASVVTIIGTGIAIFMPEGSLEKFLYFIGSVFAPMAAILIADYFILKRDSFENIINYKNTIIWIIGFILYRISMNFETPIGNTIPIIVIVILICYIVGFMENNRKKS